MSAPFILTGNTPLVAPTITGPATVKYDNVGSDGANPVTGLFVKNTTAATGPLTSQQDPPSLELDGQYWDGSATQPGSLTVTTHFGTSGGCNLIFLMKAAQSAGYSVLYKNNNVATSGQNCQCPNLSSVGFVWNGSSSIQETWSFQHVVGSGSNPTSVWKLLHSGSSGQATFDLTNGGSGYKVTVPTVAVDSNDTQVASTAYVTAQLSASGDGTPAMDGVAARGTSTHSARADHVHPTDTSRAPLASPALTGTPTAPTAAANDNSTKIATTAYVDTIFPRAVANRVLKTQSAVDGAVSTTLYTVPTGGAGVYRICSGLTCRTKSSGAWTVATNMLPPTGTNVIQITQQQLAVGTTGGTTAGQGVVTMVLADADVIKCGTTTISGSNTGGTFDVAWTVERLV